MKENIAIYRKKKKLTKVFRSDDLFSMVQEKKKFFVMYMRILISKCFNKQTTSLIPKSPKTELRISRQ